MEPIVLTDKTVKPNDYINARRFKIGRAITLIMNDSSDLDIVFKLAEMKLGIK